MPSAPELDARTKKQRDALQKDIEALTKDLVALARNVDGSIKDAEKLRKEG